MTQAIVITVCCVAGVLCLLAVVLAMMLVYKRNQLRELKLEKEKRKGRRSSNDDTRIGAGIFQSRGAGAARVGHDHDSVGSHDDRERRRSHDLILQGASRALVGRPPAGSRSKRRSKDSVSSERTGQSADNRSNNSMPGAVEETRPAGKKKQININACETPESLSEVNHGSGGEEHEFNSDEECGISSGACCSTSSLKPVRYALQGPMSSYHYIETVDESESPFEEVDSVNEMPVPESPPCPSESPSDPPTTTTNTNQYKYCSVSKKSETKPAKCPPNECTQSSESANE